MTRTEIIEMSLALTERKSERQLPLQSLYRFVLQDICKRQRFWWRRVAFNFTLSIGVPTYDLSQITTVPATALTEISLDEITKFTVILTPNPLQVSELNAVFDPETLVCMSNNTVNASPDRYTMNAGDYKTLLIDPPDQAYTAYIAGWGMPDPKTESAIDVVPLIPPWGHNAIVWGLVAYLFDFAYGSANQKSVTAAEKYEMAIQDLEQRKQFDPNYKLQMNLQESAVRST
jgi:hypothetical protein